MDLAVDKLVDKYFWVARVLPGLILAVPLVVVAFGVMPGLCDVLDTAFAKVGTSGAILFLLGSLTRCSGKAIEPRLWRRWDGPPTTRLLRWRDASRTDKWKEVIHAKVHRLTGIRLMTAEQEARQPTEADKLIADAQSMLRSTIRNSEAASLVNSLNMEYGFARNLLGSGWPWIGTSLVATLASLVGLKQAVTAAPYALIIGAASLLLAMVCTFKMLPHLVKQVADRYAEEFWSVIASTPCHKETTNGEKEHS